MALDHVGLFTIIGKYVKTVNLWNGYISAMTTQKNEIRDAYEAEDLHDIYATVPTVVADAQNGVSRSINALVGNLRNLLLDRDYVVEQLGMSSFSVSDVLNALFKYMTDGSITIDTSQVSIGGSDADFASSTMGQGGNPGQYAEPTLFCCRTLDGFNAPGNGVSANIYFSGLESQLARSTSVFGEIIDDREGQERIKLYSSGPETSGYQVQDEEPGPGPQLLTAEVGNLVPSNYNFTSWTGNAPNNWTVSGTVTTDYLDASGTGAGPLQIKTVGVTAHQQITGLTNNRLYFAIAMLQYSDGGSPGAGTAKIRFRNAAGTTIGVQRSYAFDTLVDDLGFGMAFTAHHFPDTVDLSNVYVEVEHDAEHAGGASLKVYKVVVVPATYYNGLAWAFWAPYQTVNGTDVVSIGSRMQLTVANNDNGVFGTFFRRAFQFQLPSADSPTISDSLAT